MKDAAEALVEAAQDRAFYEYIKSRNKFLNSILGMLAAILWIDSLDRGRRGPSEEIRELRSGDLRRGSRREDH